MYSPQLPLARSRPASSSDLERTQADPGSVEASLLHHMHHHHSVSLHLRDRSEKAKKDAAKSAAVVSDLLVDAVNGGVQEAFINEKRIELEIRSSTATIGRFMKQMDQWLAASHAMNNAIKMDQWLAASHAMNNAIKEIGDFENWMKVMAYDCRSINAAIRNIHQG